MALVKVRVTCAHCKVDADYIGDRLERHLPSCEYRIQKQKNLEENFSY